MKGNVSDRPARKNPLSESAPTPPRDFHQVMPATRAVKKMKDANVRNMADILGVWVEVESGDKSILRTPSPALQTFCKPAARHRQSDRNGSRHRTKRGL